MAERLVRPEDRARLDGESPGSGEERGPRGTGGVGGLVGASEPMQRVFRQIEQVADTSVTVLIRGESGTGKELIAQAVHARSRRAGGPFVSVNCAALPPTLIESELFGLERGAVTGEVSRYGRLLESADGGTLFLDEIGDLDVTLQVKLLRVMQQREVRRVDGDRAVSVDVRVLAATHQDLERAMEAGRFRDDLYYRLNVFSIFAPPLRERRSDIPLLAEHFVEKHGGELGREGASISTSAMELLMGYGWPGNIRELENTIVRALLSSETGIITYDCLPPALRQGFLPPNDHWSLSDRVARYERRIIEEALESTRGNRAQAARLLQTTDRILGYRLQQYGIDSRRYRG